VPSQEEEQQRPGVGHGSGLGAWPSQETLVKGKGRAWGAARFRTEPFRKKDHATYLGAQRLAGGWGGCAHQQPGTRPPSTSGTSQRCAPAGAVPVTSLGTTLLRPCGSSGRAPAHTVAGDSPALGGSPGGGAATRTARRATRRVRPAVPRTGVTAGEAWQEARVPWQAAVRASPEPLEDGSSPAGILPLPARAGECAW